MWKDKGNRKLKLYREIYGVPSVSRCWLLLDTHLAHEQAVDYAVFAPTKHPVRVPLGAEFIDYTNNKEILGRGVEGL